MAISPNGSFSYVANRAAGVVTDGSLLYASVFQDSSRTINEVAILDTQNNTVLTRSRSAPGPTRCP